MLLDTCVLLWLESDPSVISSNAKGAMSQAPEGLFASAISAFEIGQKAAAGKLRLPLTVDEWFAAVLRRHGLRELAVSAVIAARATLLPQIHCDPFDRLLVATAIEHRLALVTPDTSIAKYPGLAVVW